MRANQKSVTSTWNPSVATIEKTRQPAPSGANVIAQPMIVMATEFNPSSQTITPRPSVGFAANAAPRSNDATITASIPLPLELPSTAPAIS